LQEKKTRLIHRGRKIVGSSGLKAPANCEIKKEERKNHVCRRKNKKERKKRDGPIGGVNKKRGGTAPPTNIKGKGKPGHEKRKGKKKEAGSNHVMQQSNFTSILCGEKGERERAGRILSSKKERDSVNLNAE